jgi:hypothetical protein
MKKNNEIEKRLLNDSDYEKTVKSHIEKEFRQELKGKKQANKYITNIKQVSEDKIFSKDATYEVLNKISKTRSYINGIQAEGYLGDQNSDREKLISGTCDCFVSGDCFIKFIKVRV